MSSGFVPAGTSPPPPSAKDSAWAAARAAVTATPVAPEDSRSLYDVLQANKAAKQEAFEEALKFKNQFQPLDEADVEYLDSVVDSQRREEAARRREVERSVHAFRRLQSEVDRPPDVEVIEEVAWGKRKRGGRRKSAATKELRRDSSSGLGTERLLEAEPSKGGAEKPGAQPEKIAKTETTSTAEKATESVVPTKSSPPTAGLGLVDYGSEDEDD